MLLCAALSEKPFFLVEVSLGVVLLPKTCGEFANSP